MLGQPDGRRRSVSWAGDDAPLQPPLPPPPPAAAAVVRVRAGAGLEEVERFVEDAVQQVGKQHPAS